MSDVWILSEAQMRKIEPFSRFLVEFRGLTIDGYRDGCGPSWAGRLKRSGDRTAHLIAGER